MTRPLFLPAAEMRLAHEITELWQTSSIVDPVAWDPVINELPSPTKVVDDDGNGFLVRTLGRGHLPGVPGETWVYEVRHYRIIASIDDTSRFGPLLHLSVSHQRHDPPWWLVREVKRLFFPPEVAAMMVLPEEGNYVNISAHCFHLWQMPVGWGMQ